MQMNHKKKNTIMRSQFATMSTEELKNLIKTDCMAEQDDQMDIDTIMYLMEVIDARDNDANTPALEIDPIEAQADFTATYCADPTPAQNPPVPIDTQKKKSSHGLRFLIVALVAVMVCSVSVSAFHLNFLQMFAEWTEDTFQFIAQIVMGSEAEEGDPLSELREMVLKQSKVSMVPYWCPDGFEEIETIEYALMSKSIFKSTLARDEDEIIVTITQYFDGVDTYTYTSEKEATDAVKIEQGGITYYMMENTGSITMTWLSGDFMCEIVGNITLEEMRSMIESIEKG